MSKDIGQDLVDQAPKGFVDFLGKLFWPNELADEDVSAEGAGDGNRDTGRDEE